MKEMTFIGAAKDFVGLKDGQTALDFGKEVWKLTPEDRAEITAGLEQNGYKILPTVALTTASLAAVAATAGAPA